jgi:hypothetical protein
MWKRGPGMAQNANDGSLLANRGVIKPNETL